jgi:antitoxin component YwqK of YwqJK toxin-antitoxin module
VSSIQGQTINQRDKQGKKQGVWENFYDNDSMKVRYRGVFVNDLPVDTFLYYYKTGELQTLMIHDDRQYAYIINYYPEGDRMSEGRYWKQQKDSVWRYYNSQGQRVSREFYIEGKRYGLWSIYHDNGKLAEEKNWENDLEQGEFKQYYRSGNVRRDAQYVKGALEGKAHFYHENGKIRMEGMYYHDAKNGEWVEYNEKGEVTRKLQYINGVPKGGLTELQIEDTSLYYRKDRLDESDFYPQDSYAPLEKKKKK